MGKRERYLTSNRPSFSEFWYDGSRLIMLVLGPFLLWCAPMSAGAQGPPPREVQKVEGKTEKVVVPMVSEPSSKTATSSLPVRKKREMPIGRPPGYAKAKEEAERRRKSASATPAPPASTTAAVGAGPAESRERSGSPDRRTGRKKRHSARSTPTAPP